MGLFDDWDDEEESMQEEESTELEVRQPGRVVVQERESRLKRRAYVSLEELGEVYDSIMGW